MKLIRQSKLFFKEGKSDKVYETDLCQVSDDEYVVNFRFGRRGSKLREGTKTVFPVPRPNAEKIFENLVRSKIKKGYKEALTDISVQTEDAPKPDTGREAAILSRLKDAAEGRKTAGKKWPLSRIIWRAGELKLAAAVPWLVELAYQGDGMHRYCIAWALGRCASEGDKSALNMLRSHIAVPYSGDSGKRIATAAVLRLDKADETLSASLLAELPEDLSAPLTAGDTEALQKTLTTYLSDPKTVSADCLTTLYLLSDRYPAIRQVLKNILSDLPLKPNFFRPVRHIFKLAEFREDHEFYGLLAYRFEKTDEFYKIGPYYGYVRVGNEYIYITKEQQKKQPRVAYSDRTREYLRRRILRTLKRTGEAGDATAYTGMATEFLLMFSDEEDAGRPFVHYKYHFDERSWRSHTETVHHDVYAPYLAFNHILYARSRRYTYKKGSRGMCATL